jgi:hypothetical protein
MCVFLLENALLGGTVASQPQNDVLRGSMDLLVLKTLSLAPMHGWVSGSGSSKSLVERWR